MDARDLFFFVRNAQKIILRRRLEAIQTSRMAWMKDEDYAVEIEALRQKIREIDYGKGAVVAEGWNDLMRTARG